MSGNEASTSQSILNVRGCKTAFRYSEKQRTALFRTVYHRLSKDEEKVFMSTGKLPTSPHRLSEIYDGIEHEVAENFDRDSLPPGLRYKIHEPQSGDEEAEEGLDLLQPLSEEEAAPLVDLLREQYLSSVFLPPKLGCT